MSCPIHQPANIADDTAAALRLSEATKSAILECALDCIITIDHQGRVLDFNPAAERTFGYTRAETLGREMSDLIVPTHLRHRHREGLSHAAASGQSRILGQRIEITAMRKSGEEFPVELAITRVPTNGPPIFTGHIRDISARKQAEQRRAAELSVTRALAEAESLAEAAPKILRAVCESLQWDVGALWRVDRDGSHLRSVDLWHVGTAVVAAFSEATRSLVFARGMGLPGRIWASGEAQWIPDVVSDKNFPRADIASENGLHSAFGFPIRCGDEILGVIEFFSREIRQPNKEVLEMFDAVGSQLGQFIERKEAEAQIRELKLQESEARVKTILEHAPEAIMSIDADTFRFVEVNESAVRLFGRSREELLRIGPADLSPAVQPDGRSSAEVAMEKVSETLRGGTPVFEWMHFNAAGEEVLCEVRLARFPASGRKLCIGTITDITQRKNAEQELRNALAMEKELSRLKSNFVTLVSHEFRTPLGVILSSAQIMEQYFKRLTPEQRTEHLHDIQQSASHMASLMEEILLLGRVEAGRVEYRPEGIRLREFCQQLVEEIQTATREVCKIDFTATRLPAGAVGDSALLRHILTNLLSNAVKYSSPGSTVKLTAERQENQAVFCVADNGIGIPEADLKQLFQSFHRGGNVGHIAGTGLGMVLVKRCVDLHRGAIEVESKEGRGTTVTVRLPLFES